MNRKNCGLLALAFLVGVLVTLIARLDIFPESQDLVNRAVTVEAPVVSSPKLSPESGAKPSSSVEEVEKKKDKLLKLNLEPTFDVK